MIVAKKWGRMETIHVGKEVVLATRAFNQVVGLLARAFNQVVGLLARAFNQVVGLLARAFNQVVGLLARAFNQVVGLLARAFNQVVGLLARAFNQVVGLLARAFNQVVGLLARAFNQVHVHVVCYGRFLGQQHSITVLHEMASCTCRLTDLYQTINLYTSQLKIIGLMNSDSRWHASLGGIHL